MFSADLAQQILDELAGRMKAGAIRGTPIAYLRGLVKRARAGTFTPEAAWGMVRARESHGRTATARHGAPAVTEEPALPAVINDADPLVRRLLAIQARARERNQC